MSQQLTFDQAFSSEIKSEMKNPQAITSEPKKNNHLLNKKRNKDLERFERNYLNRRFYHHINPNNEYEKEAKTFSILNHFDFDSPPYNKFSSIKNISANAFWFLICSNYFPYFANELLELKIYIPEEITKLIEYINNNSISVGKKNQNFGEKFNFLKNLKNIVNKFSKKKNNSISNEKSNLFQTTNINNSIYNNIHNENKKSINISNLSCTNNISSIKSLLENLIKYFEHQNESNIPPKIKNDFLLKDNYKNNSKAIEDIELDIKYHTNSFEKFRETILNKSDQSDEDENDDIVCNVCGDGEYEDDNLIIYCSKCNITVHQKCYGVLVIPDEDWICHLCRSFDDVDVCNKMECILCPNLGGAMKPCTLRKSSHSYKVMIKNRKNPFLKDNINKNYNLNNNLINSISVSEENKDKDKDNKNVDDKDKINSKVKNENSNNNNNSGMILLENNFENNQNNTSNLIQPNVNNIMKNININNNNNNNNDFNTNTNNNQTNSVNENNIQNNNPLEASSRSLNINKDIDSIVSNSSSIKINTKEENENETNPINTSTNPINKTLNSLKKNYNKKQGQKAKSQNEIYLSEKIANENAWVHLSCALWLPELVLANFDLKEKIKGVENIPKKKLMEQCNICLKSGYGPTIKCQKCDYRFHPECARRLKNFFLEISENESGELSYLAYCNKDAAPKHLKKYELIRQRKRDDIKKFAEAIRKDIGSLIKLYDDKRNNIYKSYCVCENEKEFKKCEEKKISKKISKNNNISENNLINDNYYNDSTKKVNTNNSYNYNDNYNYEKNIELSNSEKKSLLNAIREMLIDESNLTLEINSEDFSMKTNNTIRLNYEELQYPEKFCWNFLNENQYYLKGISNYETFKIFQTLIPNKNDYAKNILKEKIISPEKTKKSKNKAKEKHNAKTALNVVYCVCKKNVGENWVGCDNKNGGCPGKEWYHISCLPELKNFTMQSFADYYDKYYCPKCRELYHLENVVKNVKEVNEINVPISNEENSNKNDLELEMKKKESNVVESVNINIDNHEAKSEENKNKDKDKDKDNNNNTNINSKRNKGECPMETEENIKEDDKEKEKEKMLK